MSRWQVVWLLLAGMVLALANAGSGQPMRRSCCSLEIVYVRPVSVVGR